MGVDGWLPCTNGATDADKTVHLVEEGEAECPPLGAQEEEPAAVGKNRVPFVFRVVAGDLVVDGVFWREGNCPEVHRVVLRVIIAHECCDEMLNDRTGMTARVQPVKDVLYSLIVFTDVFGGGAPQIRMRGGREAKSMSRMPTTSREWGSH